MTFLRRVLGPHNQGNFHAPRWAHVETLDGSIRICCDRDTLLDARRITRFNHLVTEVLQNATNERPRIELDLTQVEKADTKLLATLVAAAREARQKGLQLVIRASERVRELVALCRLDVLIAE